MSGRSSGLPSLAVLRYLDRAWRPPTTFRCRSPNPTSPCSRSTTRSRARTCFRGMYWNRSNGISTIWTNAKTLAGLVIRSAKPGMFIAGADLKEFAAWLDAPKEEVAGFCRRGQQLFGRLRKVALCHRRRDRRHLRRRRRRACDLVRPADYHRQRQDRVWFPGSEAGPVPRLGRHGPHAADGRPVERASSWSPAARTIDARTAAAMGLANDVVAMNEPSPSPSLQGRGVRRLAARGSDPHDPRGAGQSGDSAATASAGPARSTSAKPSSAFSARRPARTSSSKPRGTTRPRWRRWR